MSESVVHLLPVTARLEISDCLPRAVMAEGLGHHLLLVARVWPLPREQQGCLVQISTTVTSIVSNTVSPIRNSESQGVWSKTNSAKTATCFCEKGRAERKQDAWMLISRI